MGLKNLDGLDPGGLRNLSSLQDAFFDVAITNTNSPIQQGDTLVVDYSVDNTGGVSDTQEIRLEIDSAQEDADAGVFLVSGEATTGTLEWVTASDETAQDYTATVLSADDTASQTVTVEAVSTIPNSGVARWTFDNDDTDSGTAVDVWNGNDATINGATTGASGANQTYTTNEAYSFDGTDDYLNAGTDSALNPSSTLSVAVWMYPTQKSNSARILGRWSSSSAGNTDSYIVGIHGGTNTLEFSWRSGGVFNRVGYDLSNISTNTWTHYVATFDNGSVVQYLDGSQVNNGSDDSTINTGSSPTIIGDLDDNGSSPWEGEIDDLRFYDKPLSGTEVSNLYNTGSISG